MVTCDGPTPPCVMQITVILSWNNEMKQEEQHLFIWLLVSASVSGLRQRRDGIHGGLTFHGFASLSG